MPMAVHKAEPKKYAPKPTKTATQNNEIPWWTRFVQKRRDLKMANAITVYQVKSQSQCTPAKTEKPKKPNCLALRIKAVPIVSHHKMNPAFAAVVQIPANSESRF